MEENDIIKLKLDSLEATPGRNFYLRTLSWGVTALLGGACIFGSDSNLSGVWCFLFFIALIFSWAVTTTLLFSMETFNKLDRNDDDMQEYTRPFIVSIGVLFVLLLLLATLKSFIAPTDEVGVLWAFILTILFGVITYLGSLIICGFLSAMGVGASNPERELEKIEEKNGLKPTKSIYASSQVNKKDTKKLQKTKLTGSLKELYLFSADLGAIESELNTFSQLEDMREEGHSYPEHTEQYLLVMGDMKKVIESNPSHKVTLEATEVYNRALVDFALSVNSKYEQINYRDEIDTAREMLDSIDKKKRSVSHV